jgi:hypothetical protein
MGDDLDWACCHVALIDALRDYIRISEAITNDLLDEGSITHAQAAAEEPHLERCRVVLREIQDLEFNPTLDGLVQRKPPSLDLHKAPIR